MNLYVVRKNDDKTYYSGSARKCGFYSKNIEKAKIYRKLEDAKIARAKWCRKNYVRGSGGIDILELRADVTKVIP